MTKQHEHRWSRKSKDGFKFCLNGHCGGVLLPSGKVLYFYERTPK